MICPLCNRHATTKEIDADGRAWSKAGRQQGKWTQVDCWWCGSYMLTERDLKQLVTDAEIRASIPRLSSLLRERTIRKLPTTWLQLEEGPLRSGDGPYAPVQPEGCSSMRLSELLSHWPPTVIDRIERALCNLAHLSDSAAKKFTDEELRPSVLFATDADEAEYHKAALKDLGYVKQHEASHNWTLVPKGWQKFNELEKLRSSPRNPAFVAMWFGSTRGMPPDWKPPRTKDEMMSVYTEAIEPAVRNAGYLCTRADLKEHNDYIMDQVIGSIRVAPFLVADFTAHRNGVYYEAGYARGFGVPVIQTCYAPDIDHAHFDTQQLNHILWTDHVSLRERLYHRIRATVGQGPHPPPTERESS